MSEATVTREQAKEAWERLKKHRGNAIQGGADVFYGNRSHDALTNLGMLGGAIYDEATMILYAAQSLAADVSEYVKVTPRVYSAMQAICADAQSHIDMADSSKHARRIQLGRMIEELDDAFSEMTEPKEADHEQS